jgi:pimeloyl-ACP methyl ester carboxylesterase
MNALRSMLLVVAAFAGILLALVFVLIFFGQRRLIFPGSSAGGGEPEAVGGERIWLEAGAGRTEAWLLPAPSIASAGPLILYAHGNGELIDHWADAFEPARARGVSALLVEYPGYGRSGGSPSERSIRATMTAAFDHAVQRGFAPERIVGWGRSLGGGAVCALARERPRAALVLESTFTSVVSMAERMGLPAVLARLLVRDRFDNLGVLLRFAGPVLLLHGARDEVIPPAEAQALHEGVPNAELHWLPCGHNDCARPWAPVLRFLAAQGMLAPADPAQ